MGSILDFAFFPLSPSKRCSIINGRLLVWGTVLAHLHCSSWSPSVFLAAIVSLLLKHCTICRWTNYRNIEQPCLYYASSLYSFKAGCIALWQAPGSIRQFSQNIRNFTGPCANCSVAMFVSSHIWLWQVSVILFLLQIAVTVFRPRDAVVWDGQMVFF